jgi:large subunit ribosomal protein L18
MKVKTKEDVRTRIKARIRKKLSGSTGRPRLAVFRSQSHIYAQVIDDDAGQTLCAASSLDKELKPQFKRGSNLAAAKAVGQLIAGRAKAKGSRPWSSIAAASSTTAGSRRWPTPPAKPA